MNAADQTSGPPETYSRRAAIGLGAAMVAGAAIGTDPVLAATGSSTTSDRTASPDPSPSLLDALRPEIAPRSAWGADRPVIDPIVPEDDVRFLLVHHTASTNDYGPDEVTEQIRSFHQFHTGPEKGWPDVAYNFFIDRFGGIWEARQGSIDGPVRGDATGGSQGFALLCSLIGDHSQVPVTEEARASLVGLLAWLAERHGIVTEPGTVVDFVSRGSNRWPAGAEVRAATISGHRDMSQTTCPGDFAYGLLAADLPQAVSDRRRTVAAAVATTTPSPTLATTEAEAATTTTTPSTSDPSETPEQAGAALGDDIGDSSPLDDVTGPAIVAGGAAVVGAAAIAARRRRARDGDPT